MSMKLVPAHELMTASEAAKVIGYSRTALMAEVRAGNIKPVATTTTGVHIFLLSDAIARKQRRGGAGKVRRSLGEPSKAVSKAMRATGAP